MAKIVVIGVLPESLINFRGALLRTLSKAGHEVIAVSAAAPPQIVSRLNDMGVIHQTVAFDRAGMNPLRDAQTLRELYVLLRRMRPQHVLAYTAKPVIYGGLAAQWCAVPHFHALITGLGYMFLHANRVSWRQRLMVALYRQALQGAATVFFQNPDDQAFFSDLGLLAKARQTHVVNGSGVDLDHYAFTPMPKQPSFLMIARLLRAKGVYEYAEAARQVRIVYPHIPIRLAGWLERNPDSIDPTALEQWQRDDLIDFLGRLEDVRPAIATCTVYVLPSYAEGTPRTVLEAMAMGRAVITTNTRGCRETVHNGTNGFLIPPQDPTALAEAMLRYIEQPELAEMHGRAGRRLAESRYDVHAVNRKMLQAMGLAT